MSLPAGWPAPSAFETLPAVYVDVADSPLGVRAVASWSLERELVGSVLPSNVRGRSGLSIGSASAQVAQSGAPLAPWAKAADRKVVTGSAVDLYAAYDGPGSAARVDLGDWIVGPTSGSLASLGVDVDLIERQYVGRAQVNQLPIGFGNVSPAWMIDALARQVGYHATPPRAASAIIEAPLQGGIDALVGSFANGGGAAFTDRESYSRTTGPLGLDGDAEGTWTGYFYAGTLDVAATYLRTPGVSVYLTANVAGTVRFTFGQHFPQFDIPAPCAVEIRSPGVFAVRGTPTATWATGAFFPGADPNHPSRVQIEVQRLGRVGAWTGFRARVRSAHNAALWSPWVTSTAASTEDSNYAVSIEPANGANVSGFQATTALDPDLWQPNNADIDYIPGLIVYPWLPAEVDVWTGIQEVCASWLAAAWVSRDRVFTVRNGEYLGGGSPAVATIDVGASVEDLGWTIDPADDADRLVVTYAPVDLVTKSDEGYEAVAWQAHDAIKIPPYPGVVEVVADLEQWSAIGTATTWVGAWDTANLGKGSTWAVNTKRDGTGLPGFYGTVAITTRVVSAGRVIIRIANYTAVTLYTVDANGNPCLILRAGGGIALQQNTVNVTRGASELDALNPLTVDLGRYVQRPEDAEAIADYIWARVSSPAWKASSVRTRLDWARDIGDVVKLQHPRSDLSVKALVTKVAYEGQPGEVAQTLDLVLLPSVWLDFDEAWAGKTWADFDTAWATSTWFDFDNDPLRSA